MENTKLNVSIELKKECLTKVARHHVEILKIIQGVVGPISNETVSRYKECVKQSMELLLSNRDSNIIDSSIDNVFDESSIDNVSDK